MRYLLILETSLCVATAYGQAAGPDLPDIGNPAGEIITRNDELQFGRSVILQLRQQNQIFEDPEITEYLNAIGSRIAAQTGVDGQHFEFFPMRDDEIQAFALPGGFICVYRGLVLANQWKVTNGK